MVLVLTPVEITTPSKRYDSLGKCIFCGVFGKLTKEHLLAFGLGGDSLYMPRATCPSCQSRIHRYETMCLRTSWWPFRFNSGAPSQSGAPPKKFLLRRALAVREPGKVRIVPTVNVEIEPEDFPLSYMALQLEPPGILIDRDPSTNFDWTVWVKHEDAILTKMGTTDGDAFSLGVFDPFAFAQLLAKTAHGYARAELGFNFEGSLKPLICNEGSFRLHHWIGGDFNPPPSEACMHKIRWRIEDVHGVPYVVVELRLFAFLGSPIYRVVLGQFTGDLDQLPFLEQPFYTIDIKQPPPFSEVLPAGFQVWNTGI